MKKLIILLSVIFSLSISAQLSLTITSLPNYICPGDTIKCSFLWNNKSGSVPFRLVPHLGTQQGWITSSNKFYSLPKSVSGQDTTYCIKFKINSLFPLGEAKFTYDQITYTDMFIDCNVGIKESYLDELSPIYYDLQGNVTEFSTNKILIQRIGNRTKKVLIIE